MWPHSASWPWSGQVTNLGHTSHYRIYVFKSKWKLPKVNVCLLLKPTGKRCCNSVNMWAIWAYDPTLSLKNHDPKSHPACPFYDHSLRFTFFSLWQLPPLLPHHFTKVFLSILLTHALSTWWHHKKWSGEVWGRLWLKRKLTVCQAHWSLCSWYGVRQEAREQTHINLYFGDGQVVSVSCNFDPWGNG